MVFSSLSFLFRFLPLFLAVYYILPVKYRNLCLFLGSILFYAFGEPVYVVLIICSLLFNYSMGLLMGEYARKRALRIALLLFTLSINFGLLLFFKYSDFLIDNINLCSRLYFHNEASLSGLKLGLPLGISFYTFQISSYIIDVYYKKYPAEKNLLSVGVYLCMFPQLIAGPIITYPELSSDIKHRTYSKILFEDGLQIFILGLGSKVILANRIGILWHDLQTIGYDSLTTPLAWMGAFAYTFQLYFDFYGYSLMAVGLGKMLGFKLPNNFDHPYLSYSMTDFFRKWHMTLGRWFREYIYIPLGGNRKGGLRTICNLLFVWLLTGFWHGASWNFVLWGVVVGILIILEKFIWGGFLKKHRLISFLYMTFLVPLTWSLFAITNIANIKVFFCRLFHIGFQSTLLNTDNLLAYIKTFGFLFVCCLLCMTYLPDRLFHKYRKKPLGILAILAIFWISVYFLANSINNPFLYFRF